MRSYRGVTILTSVFLLAGLSACGSSNPLIGKWTLAKAGYTDRDGNQYCLPIAGLEFTPNTQTLVVANMPFRPGGRSTNTVSYNVGPKKVYVMGNTGPAGAVGYDILSHDQIEPDTIGHCIYQRTP